MQDLQYALRTLRKQPLFALVAVLTLALGIGANTAIFTLVYQTLLQPLPVANADRLAFVWNRYGAMNLAQASVSIPDYLDRKTQAAAVEDATLFTNRMAILNEGGSPEQIRSLAVTPSFFSTLGVQPVRGRGHEGADGRSEVHQIVDDAGDIRGPGRLGQSAPVVARHRGRGRGPERREQTAEEDEGDTLPACEGAVGHGPSVGVVRRRKGSERARTRA